MCKIEQQERMCAENTCRRLMITHAIDSYLIPFIPVQNHIVQRIQLQIHDSNKTRNLCQRFH